MQYKLEVLKNQLNTLFINSPESITSCVQIWFNAGSALESSSNMGIAHFLEHMFFKGTKKSPKGAIAKEVENFGGEINAFTSFDYTCYYVNSPQTHINKTVEILLDMIANPRFLIEDIRTERDVVLEEWKQSFDNPIKYNFNKLQESCFTLGYHHPILGTEKTIKKFSKKQLIEFRKNYYNISNCLLIVAGNISKESSIKKIIEKATFPIGKYNRFPKFKLKNKDTMSVHQKDTKLCRLNLLFQSPSYQSKKAISEQIAINCLGYGETSRLYKELYIKQNLVNSCNSYTMFMQDGGMHIINIVFPFEKIQNLKKAILLIIKNWYKNKFTIVEINKIKNHYISHKIYSKESIENLAFSKGESFIRTGNINYEDKYIERLKGCSIEDVNNSFLDILSKNLHINIQIPKKENKLKAENTFKDLSKQIYSLKIKNNRYSPIKNITYSKYDKSTRLIKLKNNIYLIHRLNKTTPTFVLRVDINGGLIEENKSNNGYYNFLSRIITKGYRGISYKKLREEIENSSAFLSSSSSYNSYNIKIHGQSKDLYKLLNHFMSLLITPEVKADIIENERNQILKQIENREEDPLALCFYNTNKILFKNHPYSMSITGEKQSIKNIDIESIFKTHKKNLKNKKLVFTYCGDINAETVINSINEYITNLNPNNNIKTNYKKYNNIYGKTFFKSLKRKQTNMFLYYPGYKNKDKKNIPIAIMNSYLSGLSSKLFTIVRDKMGLCYTAQPIHFNSLYGGYWGIYIACSNNKVQDSKNAIANILKEIKSKCITEEEFKNIKSKIKGNNLLLIQTNSDYANMYSNSIINHNNLDYYYKYNKLIDNITYKDFKTSISKFLQKDFNSTIIGSK